MTPLSERTWYRVFACTLTMLASIGLMAGVYAPILPSLLDHNWLTDSQAGYVAAASSIGVILGALVSARIARRFNTGNTCRISLVVGLVSILLSAINLGPWWLGANRLLAGMCISGIAISTAALITQGVQGPRRGVVIGLIGLGAGLGLILISLMLPLPFISLESGPARGWLYTGLLIAICIIFAWPGMQTRQGTVEFAKSRTKKLRHERRLILLAACYALLTMACAPIFVYLSAFVHDHYQLSLGLSSMTYAITGVGIAIGGFIFSYFMIRLFGRYVSLIVAMGCGLASSAAIYFFDDLWIALAASFVISIVHSGSSALKTYDILEIAGPLREVHWLTILKIVAAASFAAGAFMSGLLLALGLGYSSLFLMSTIFYSFALVTAFFITFPAHDTTTTS